MNLKVKSIILIKCNSRAIWFKHSQWIKLSQILISYAELMIEMKLNDDLDNWIAAEWLTKGNHYRCAWYGWSVGDWKMDWIIFLIRHFFGVCSFKRGDGGFLILLSLGMNVPAVSLSVNPSYILVRSFTCQSNNKKAERGRASCYSLICYSEEEEDLLSFPFSSSCQISAFKKNPK